MTKHPKNPASNLDKNRSSDSSWQSQNKTGDSSQEKSLPNQRQGKGLMNFEAEEESEEKRHQNYGNTEEERYSDSAPRNKERNIEHGEKKEGCGCGTESSWESAEKSKSKESNYDRNEGSTEGQDVEPQGKNIDQNLTRNKTKDFSKPQSKKPKNPKSK